MYHEPINSKYLPYKFTEDDRDFFFDRTKSIQKLVKQVQYLVETPTRHDGPDLLAVLRASKSGKSSVDSGP